jgi:nucleotide-binding universal stress UspA family protein
VTASRPPVEIRRILVPVVGVPSERGAIDYAALLAVALRASVTLVHVDELPDAMVGIVPGASIDGDLAAEQAASTEQLATIARELVMRGIVDTKTTHLVSASLAAALVELVRHDKFDLVVMATHVRTRISRILLGSIAENIVRHAACPVLTVHSS